MNAQKLFLITICCLLITVVGCINPPKGTVFIDNNGDGKIDALAVDADGDGAADCDAEGNPMIIEGSQGYRLAEGVDSVLPDILMALGGVIGVPALVGIGAAWKGSRFGRIIMNTIMSVQAARQKLKDTGNTAALELVDEVLSTQLPETAAEIKKVKEKLNLSSVTDKPVNQ